ncbi:hypothetical protein [Candidatus Arsenophonus triatominarum]|uniref:hypothetical protein n=1 Tax=Candidatus Arsenophonus triatominarum TaxID=57911 RepID=UPI000AAE821F|nr:hypothetical protein [Candidatus Arsenophonus triatominarum]
MYRTFLQVSSVRYSGLALSEVNPSPLSHDTITSFAPIKNALFLSLIQHNI